MRVTVNGEQQDLPVALKREAPLQGAQLYVGDRRVTRVTHSHTSDIPVMVQIDDMLIEVDPQDFYAIEGMNYDWQPGDQTGTLAGM
jgi:hypothetical protein